MNLFQRITTTFANKVETVVSHVENHEALVEAALRDTRAASAKARVRLTRILKDGEAMRRKLQDLQTMETTWSQRAISIAKDDEQKALECVQRRNACRKQAQQLAEALKRHEELEREVTASVERIEERLGELTQQRNMMRSRHSVADALHIINHIEASSTAGIEDIFDRWEMRITQTEYANGAGPASPDALDSSFLKQENESGLRADLHALLQSADIKE